MSTKTFSDAMGLIDDKYILEAAEYSKSTGKILRLRRIPTAAAVALLAVLLLGCAVLAAGVFGTQLLGFFHSGEESGYDLSVNIEKVPLDALTGKIRETGGIIRQQFSEYKEFDSQSPDSWQGTFATRDAACDYIGYNKLKRIDLGYDEKETTLTVAGNEQGQILSFALDTDYTAGDMRVFFSSFVFTEYHKGENWISDRATENLDYEESFYTTASGNQCQMISASAMESGVLWTDGYIVEDSVLNTLHVIYRDGDAAEAVELIRHWADLLTAK